MAETNIIGETLCPWCHNELEVVKSAKSGYHYANCKSCNSHFRNIPVALVDMEGRQETKTGSREVLDRFLREQREKEQREAGGGDALDRFLRKQREAEGT